MYTFPVDTNKQNIEGFILEENIHTLLRKNLSYDISHLNQCKMITKDNMFAKSTPTVQSIEECGYNKG